MQAVKPSGEAEQILEQLAADVLHFARVRLRLRTLICLVISL